MLKSKELYFLSLSSKNKEYKLTLEAPHSQLRLLSFAKQGGGGGLASIAESGACARGYALG